MYLFHVDSTYVPKNSLQKAVVDLIRSKDRLTFKDEYDVRVFVQQLDDKISSLNEAHPRCKPVTTGFQPTDNSDFLYYNSDVFHVSLLGSRDEKKEVGDDN